MVNNIYCNKNCVKVTGFKDIYGQKGIDNSIKKRKLKNTKIYFDRKKQLYYIEHKNIQYLNFKDKMKIEKQYLNYYKKNGDKSLKYTDWYKKNYKTPLSYSNNNR